MLLSVCICLVTEVVDCGNMKRKCLVLNGVVFSFIGRDNSLWKSYKGYMPGER